MQAIVNGKLHKDPEKKVSSKGNSYLMMTIRQPDDTYVRVSLFGDDITPLSLIKKGDAVAVVGELSCNIWERNGQPSIGMSMIAHRGISVAERKPYKPRVEPDREPYQFKRFAEVAKAMGQEPQTVNNLGDDLPWESK